MLKRVFSIKSKEFLHTHNALIKLDEAGSAGKGRKFRARFLTPGLAGYPEQFGTVLVQKETFDKFINSMVGVPVVIRHKDLNNDNADDERVGVVSNVWFDEKDGWYWCDGIIWNETAINLILDKGWSVSCSYDVLEHDDSGGTWNNTPYDMEFLNGVFTHLALVDNPRYEKANIVFNSKTIVNNKFKEEEHPRDEDGKFTDGNGKNPDYEEQVSKALEQAKSNDNTNVKVTIGEVDNKLIERAKENGFDLEGYRHNIDVYGLKHTLKKHGEETREALRGQGAITEEDIKNIPKIIYEPDEVNFTGKNRIGKETISYTKQMPDGDIYYVEEIREGNKTLTLNTMYKKRGIPKSFATNNGCNLRNDTASYIITNGALHFNPKASNIKEYKDMALIDELKKLIYKAENEKGDCMKKARNEDVDKREILREADAIAMKPSSDFKGGEEEKFRTLTKKLEELSYNKSERGTSDNEKDDDDEKADNEKTDKRELIDEVGGILKGKVSDEIIRTVMKKMEEASYNPSERDKADNETEKDDEEYEDLKKEIKEEAKNRKSCRNKANNSKTSYFDELNKVYNAPQQAPEMSLYISRDEKLKAAEEYFS